jgi:hypothetical protein
MLCCFDGGGCVVGEMMVMMLTITIEDDGGDALYPVHGKSRSFLQTHDWETKFYHPSSDAFQLHFHPKQR